jgi:hypothetical protein
VNIQISAKSAIGRALTPSRTSAAPTAARGCRNAAPNCGISSATTPTTTKPTAAPNDRQNRYDALCIATHHGDAYEDWDETHNKWGVPYDTSSAGGTGRAACKEWLNAYVGTSENPKGSNRGSPQPDGWNNAVYGSSGVPWCANFAVSAAWASGVSGSGTASVYQNTQLAKQGQGIYRGYTTDPSRVQPGDHMFISDDHTGVAYGTYQSDGTILGVEGNTSGTASSGSQWNGDVVAKKTRAASYWTGYGLVRFPD